ncbi:hypothetical protein AAH991_14355 [Microbispora sp. ZYX-F-249]|uniref:DUF1851 domain-containing protein n=1 Tax=Microbispora maris TaxID=3144104 RepID=A0ABV0ARE0_9ACTN
MSETLAYRDQTFVNFRSFRFDVPAGHAFRWVDIKRFDLPRSDPGDDWLLTALIGHTAFRDDYAGGGVEPEGLRHGPYWLRHITPARYIQIDEEHANGLLRGWAGQYGELPPDLAVRLEREVYLPLAAATSRYRLEDLGHEAFHDWGGVHTDFHELILIDRMAGVLSLLVAADD